MATDATTLLACLQRISKHYDLDFSDMLRVCDLWNPVEGDAHIGCDVDIWQHLEVIMMNKQSRLYDPLTRRVYTNEKNPRMLGLLCPTSLQIIENAP